MDRDSETLSWTLGTDEENKIKILIAALNYSFKIQMQRNFVLFIGTENSAVLQNLWKIPCYENSWRDHEKNYYVACDHEDDANIWQ